MKNKSQELKDTLLNLIHQQKENSPEHIRNPDKDFVRNRKLPYDKMITSLLTME